MRMGIAGVRAVCTLMRHGLTRTPATESRWSITMIPKIPKFKNSARFYIIAVLVAVHIRSTPGIYVVCDVRNRLKSGIQ